MSSLAPIYLDYAAATPVAPAVISAMQPYMSDVFYNPSSAYLPAVKVRQEYEAAKAQLAHTFGAKGDECVVTAGATESINLAFSHIRRHVVTTTIEHPAVLAVARAHDHTLVATNRHGRVSIDDIRSAIRDDTELISIGLANSEIGTIQPLRKIAHIIKDIRRERQERGIDTPLVLHSDASQGFGYVDINVARLGVDLLTLNAAKIYGPKQVGLLWIHPSVQITPTILGGGQERGLRSGTENVSGVIGFAVAAEEAVRHMNSESKRLQTLRDSLQTRLTEAFPNAEVFGDQKHRLPNILSLGFADIDAERIIFMVEEQLLISTGSACSANKHTASHVLLGIDAAPSLVGGSLRLSLGKMTSEQDIDRASEILTSALTSEYKRMNR